MKKNDQFFIVENIDLSKKNSANWVEDSFAAENNLTSVDNAGFMGLSLPLAKLKLFYLFIFLGLVILLARSFYLQIISGNSYFSLAENNRIKTEYNKASRGIIFDRNGKQLVQNIFGFSLSIAPSQLPAEDAKREKVLAEASRISGVSIEEIKNKIKDAQQFYWQPLLIKNGIDYEQAMSLKIMSDDLPGLILDTDSWRKYPYPESFSHILGYVSKINAQEYEASQDKYLLNDNIGKNGLEKTYETYLKGQHGQKKIEVDALGREKKIISQTTFIPGDSLILSIDADLQERIFSILKEKIPGRKATVIVSNPQNGEILALVDYPSYDNNLFGEGISTEDYNKLLTDENKPLFTRSIFGEYPSGSTIKPVMASAALEEKIIDKNTTVNSTGGIKVGAWFFPDWKAGGHGVTNVTKALAQSVNTFFYYIGGGYGNFKGLGMENIVKYFKLFGLGEKTGIDLPGERSGFVPTPQWKQDNRHEVWYIGDTYHLSIGQGDLLVTPLQVNNYTVAVANGGRLLVPRLGAGVVHPDKTKEVFPTKIIRENFVSAETLKIVREGMRETVVSGSARSLSTLPVEAAGKTGTAQWHTDRPNHAWFTGFAPYNDPNFCITVLVEEGGEGSSISVPIAREIMAYWFNKK